MVEVSLDEEFYKAFRKLLEALKSYNKEIVVIGGLANALYEFHNLGKKSPLETISTKDLDLLEILIGRYRAICVTPDNS